MSKLKTLLLRKKIDDSKKALAALIAKDKEFEERGADLAEAFNEITEETPEEDRKMVEDQMTAYDSEKDQHDSEKKNLEDVIRSAEAELAEAEEKQDEKPAEEPAPVPEAEPEERKDVKMSKNKIIRSLSMQERTALLSNEGMKNWLAEIRSAIKEKRALTNVGLTVPEVLLPLLRENIAEYSKLYDRVNLQRVGGEARQPIMGTIPEAIWTECCATLNELTLVFNDWEVDCFKVGGYYAVCNANLEDSDIDLMATILEALGQGIGKALDKAILYGRNISTNSKMPLGVVSRILQTAQPSDYPSTARTWADLHSTHVVAVGTSQDPVSGMTLLKGLVNASAVAANDYARGALTWAMNDATYKKIVAETLEVNASGAVVSAINGAMPVVGGDTVVLNFLPDDVIIFGYFDLYLLAERAARNFAQSEHVRFLQDQTVFKGTARYDGAPIIAEAFGIVTLNGATATASAVTFPQDTAN